MFRDEILNTNLSDNLKAYFCIENYVKSRSEHIHSTIHKFEKCQTNEVSPILFPGSAFDKTFHFGLNKIVLSLSYNNKAMTVF